MEASKKRISKNKRSLETRKKIQLGGLITKAGLDKESNALLYGLLIDAAERLEGDKQESWRARWETLGDRCFHNKP